MLKLLASQAWQRIKNAWPVNRVVVVLTPLLFAPVAGYVTAWVAQNFPGLPALDPLEVTGLFALGATIAFGKAYKWLDGWQKDMFPPAASAKKTPTRRK